MKEQGLKKSEGEDIMIILLFEQLLIVAINAIINRLNLLLMPI